MHAPEIKVGTIFRNSWGYDQTNIDYFKVIRRTAKCAVIVEIGYGKGEATGFMQGTCTPDPDNEIGEPMTKRILPCGDKWCLKIHSWGSYAFVDSGRPSHWTSYA